MSSESRGPGLEDVSRETQERLEAYLALLKTWNRRINLVSNETLDHAWSRHFLDSLQLGRLILPDTQSWADLGSGAGFPGMILAICRPDIAITLVESDARKVAFLRTVARETDTDVHIVRGRIEELPELGVNAISARALAALPKLLSYCERHLAHGGYALFPKGRGYQAEIASALESWSFDCETHPSVTEDDAVILRLTEIERVR